MLGRLLLSNGRRFRHQSIVVVVDELKGAYHLRKLELPALAIFFKPVHHRIENAVECLLVEVLGTAQAETLEEA